MRTLQTGSKSGSTNCPYCRDLIAARAQSEAKRRAALAKTTIDEARAALSRDHGRPTPTSLLFIADRLMERDDDKAVLGRKIRNEVASRAVPPLESTMSFSRCPEMLRPKR
jgi:hypothetical protein